MRREFGVGLRRCRRSLHVSNIGDLGNCGCCFPITAIPAITRDFGDSSGFQLPILAISAILAIPERRMYADTTRTI
jgi:hypothetical protein